MNESYYAGVYWPGRREPVDAYARRGEAFFQRLALLDPALTQWFEQANSREMALKSQFTPTAAALLGLFGKKKYQTRVGELDFWAWNGESEGSSEVNFCCGSPSPRTVDLCVFTPPPKGHAAERILTSSILTQALRAMVLAWEPEWGVATSTAHRKSMSNSAAPGTFVGWVTYLSHRRGAVPALPAPVRVEPVEDKGSLIILTPSA